MTNEQKVVVGALAFFAAFGAWLQLYNPEHMEFVCQEDGFVEYSEAFLYLWAAGIFAYVGSHKGFRNVWYFGYALLFLFVCGEEVSWGQRIFKLATPGALDAVNLQHELNLHNLDGIHQHHHLYGMIVCATIAYGFPLTDRFLPWARSFYRRFNLPIFPGWLFALPTIAFAYLVIPRLYGKANHNTDEMSELYLAMAFFGFALDAHRRASAAWSMCPAEPIQIQPVELPEDGLRRPAAGM
jgi:hypothetical protein